MYLKLTSSCFLGRKIPWSFTSDNLCFRCDTVSEKSRQREKEGARGWSQTKTHKNEGCCPPVHQIVPVELDPVPGHALPVSVIGDVSDDCKHVLRFNHVWVLEQVQIPKRRKAGQQLKINFTRAPLAKFQSSIAFVPAT